MLATIISIGDELLYGDTVNTNANWLGKQLSACGIQLKETITVHDTPEAIVETLDRALESSELVITTGGLGPTKDDLTKKTLNEYFGGTLVKNEEIAAHIEALFKSFNREMKPVHHQQAELPNNCEAMHNRYGTAAGMYFNINGKHVLAMPGVPHEMKAIFEESFLPKFLKNTSLPKIIHRYVMTAGIGESNIAEKIADIEDALPPYIKLAYLPSIMTVKLRLSGFANNEEQLIKELELHQNKIADRLTTYTFALDSKISLAASLGTLLKERKLWLATAESCTSGNIARHITSVSGSSQYFKGSLVAYSDDIKRSALNVAPEIIKNNGAVSEETVKAMVKGAVNFFNVDVGIAVSGIMGPTGARPGKPVGTVWIAVGSIDNILAKRFQLGKYRDKNVVRTTVLALDQLRKFLLQ